MIGTITSGITSKIMPIKRALVTASMMDPPISVTVDRSAIDMDCIRYDQPSRHFTYTLQVIGNNNSVLIDKRRVIGHYQRYQR